MPRYDNEWEREQERERGRFDERDRERGPSEQRGSERAPYTGWAGRGFNQGSFGRYGGQGERLYARYGGHGFGAQHGYGGGMSTYQDPGRGESGWAERNEERERDYWGSQGGYGQGSEGWRRGEDRGEDRRRFDDRQHYETRDRDREDWSRDWGGQGFSGREGGWGGYGSYDRERGVVDRDRGGHLGQTGGTSGLGTREAPYGGWQRPPSYMGVGAGYYGESWGGSQRGWGGHSAGSISQSDWRQRRGQFAGRGPKGWQRSDDRIREDVNERLTDHPDVDASEIEVEVHNGEVTLRGNVGDRETKRLAEDIVEHISGVRDVHNQIRVNRGFWGSIKDAITGESDDEANRRDRSGQPETTTADRVSTTSGTQTTTSGSTQKETTGIRR